MANSPIPRSNFAFPKSHHLRRQREFDAVYAARVMRRAGPLRVYAKPNGLSHCRLGLSVSTRVGNAVRRNRIKRLIREAFRLLQHELPPGYDLVAAVNPHEPRTLADYQRLLSEAAGRIDRHYAAQPPDA